MTSPINQSDDHFFANEELYRALAESSQDSIFVVDKQGYIRYVNSFGARFLGLPPEKIQGRHLRDLFAPDACEVQSRALQHVFESGEPVLLEEDKSFAERKIWLETRLIPIRSKDNAINHVMGVARDITELRHSQEELRQTADRLEAILKASPAAVVALDLEGRVTHWNKAAEQIFGWSREEVIGKPHPIVPEDKYEEYRALLERAMSGEAFIGVEVRRRKKNGLPVDIDISVAPLHNRLGEIYGCVAVINDITERRRAEEALLNSENRYHALFSQLPEGIVILNTEGKIIEFNESAHRGLGYTREEFSQLSVSDLDPFENADEVKARIRKIMQEGKADFYVRHRTKQGELRDVHVITQVIMLSGSHVLHSIWHDVTEIKNTQHRLEEKTAEQNAILENAFVGIAFLTNRRFIWINSRMEQMFGYQRNEVSGLTTEAFYPSHESYEQFGKDAYPLLASGETYSSERLMKRKDGSVFWCSLSGKAIDAASFSKGSIWILQDITDRKRAEEEIMKLNRDLRRRASELESAYKDMESFSYAASHDLKAPVTRIAGFSEILLEDYADQLDDNCRDWLSRISNNTKKMRQLIEDLLAFSSFSAKEIQKTSIDMESLIRSAYEEAKSAAGERNIRLDITALPLADGDVSLIRQVLLNLITNAIKFTRVRDAASIEVGGRTEGDENIYYVRDNGIGFDMQFVDKLFSLFQRIHISKEFEGTGIGLVIVKRIIEKHGGRVWAEGKPNEGATFYFSIPKNSEKIPSDRLSN